MKQRSIPGVLDRLSSFSRLWLRHSGADAVGDNQARLNVLRQQMLVVLGEPRPGQDPRLRVRIQYANADALWYLRPVLLTALSQREGEPMARARIDEINLLFEGLVSPSLAHCARPPQHES